MTITARTNKRHHSTTLLGLALALVFVAGCASDVGDTGTPLVEVNVEQLTSQLHYYAPEYAAEPLTLVDLAELGLAVDEAVPVRIEVFERSAVAWYAPGGEALIGREMIVALWTVHSRTPVRDDTAANPGERGVESPLEVAVALDGVPPSVEELAGTPGLGFVGRSAAEVAIIEFADRLGSPYEFEYLRELESYHPGCLEE